MVERIVVLRKEHPVRLIPNEEPLHFSDWDKISKFVWMKAYKRQTSTATADFVYHLK